MHLKDRIRISRRNAGLTQGQLAKIVGVSRPAIAQWETGVVQTIEAANAIRAAHAMHVDPFWLVSGEGAPYHLEDKSFRMPQELLTLWESMDADSRAQVIELCRHLAKKSKLRRERSNV